MPVSDPAGPGANQGGRLAIPSGADPRAPAPAPGDSLLGRLQSLQEMQAALVLEEREDEILRVGVTATVEILGADCGIAVLDGTPPAVPPAPGAIHGRPGLRCGWGEGRQLARHEVEILHRSLEEDLKPIREGAASRVLLAADPGPAEGAELDGGQGGATLAEPPAPLQARRLGSILAQAIGNGAGRRGVLILARRDPAPFARETTLLVEILANQIVVHLERARRAAEAHRASESVQQEVESATRGLRERNRELEALNAVAATAIPSFDLERQVEAALRKAAEVTRHAAGAIYLVETEEGGDEILRCARAFGEPACVERAGAQRLRRGEGMPGRVWRTGQAIALADLSVDPEVGGCEALAQAGYHGLLCLPMAARGRAVGVMELLATEVRGYTEDQIGLARAVADQVGFAVQNTRLFSDVMRYSLELEGRLEAQARDMEIVERQARALLGVIGAAGRSDDPGSLLEAALSPLLDLNGASCAAAWLVDPASGDLNLRAHRGFPPGSVEELERIGRGDSFLDRAAEAEEPVFASSLSEAMQGLQGRLGKDGVRFAAALPLRSRGRLRGILLVAVVGEPLTGEKERAFLAALGRLIAMALPGSPVAEAPSPEPARHEPEAAGPGREERPGAMPAQLLQSQKMESIGTLASGIAHDFNNIIGAIMGYASYIKSLVTSDNPIYRQATTIEEQSQRAADLTGQLLAFARGGQYVLEPVDMNRMVAEVVSFLSKSLDRNILLEVHTEPDLPAVEADASQMKQILLNIAVNARDALPQGGRIIFETHLAHLDAEFARSSPEVRPGDYVEIVVGDTGIGMPPEIVDRVFEPFFTTKPAGVGTGLGLSAVFGIVKNHRGHVDVSSTQGVGTTVRIYLPSSGRAPLPVAAKHAPEPASGSAPPSRSEPAPEPEREMEIASAPLIETPAAEGAPPAPELPPARAETVAPPPAARPIARPAARPAAGGMVLVVDDEAAIREMASDILKLRGYEVLLARDGVEALELYRQHWGRVDLVLLDMVMPRLGGLETYRRLLGMDRGVRVLLCSGYSHNEPAQRAIKEGALGLLSKPFTMIELLAWVERLANRPEAGRPQARGR